MEFQFGTNWAGFSRYAGGVIGQMLAMKGLFAFFLEMQRPGSEGSFRECRLQAGPEPGTMLTGAAHTIRGGHRLPRGYSQ
jgi:hypothetical protein